MDVWQIVEAVPESTAGYFQIVRTGRSMPQLKVRVGFDPGETGRAAVAVRADLTETIASVLGIAAPDIELVDNEVLLRQGPPHKIPRVVSS
jgi:phenylacetate-CoA ligase